MALSAEPSVRDLSGLMTVIAEGPNTYTNLCKKCNSTSDVFSALFIDFLYKVRI